MRDAQQSRRLINQLDTLDRKVLYYLDHDARQSISELSRKLKQNRDTVRYRIDRLQSLGVIKAFTATVNHCLLDLSIFKIYMRVDTSASRMKALAKYFKEHPRVYWLARCDGNWDLMVAIVARSAEEFYRMHMGILSRFNDIILSSSVITLVDVVMFRKNYLIGEGENYFRIGGESAGVLLDEIDYGILKVLDDDARTPTTTIAELLETTPTVVNYRIEKLEQAGVLLGYRLDLDIGRLGMLFFKSQFYLRNYRKKLLEEFFDYCNANPHITYYLEQLGEWTLEIELEVYDYEQYYQIMDELRARFSKLIRNFQSVLIREQEYKWIPRDLVLQ